MSRDTVPPVTQNDGVEETEQAAEIESLPTGQREDSSRVTLRPSTGHDQDEFLELVRASVDLHHPWMSRPATAEDFRTLIALADQLTAHGPILEMPAGPPGDLATAATPARLRSWPHRKRSRTQSQSSRIAAGQGRIRRKFRQDY